MGCYHSLIFAIGKNSICYGHLLISQIEDGYEVIFIQFGTLC